MKNIKDAVEKAIKNIRTSLTGKISSVIKTDKTIYVRASEEEEIRDVKIISPYGFFSLPTNNQNSQILFNNNSAKKPVHIGVEHDSIPVDLGVGESIMYNPTAGTFIHLDNKGNINFQGNSNLKAGSSLFASVIDYGAKGNNIADDTNAFNTALTKENTVWVPDGTYKVSSIILPVGKKLLLSEKAILVASSNSNVITMKEGSSLHGGEIKTDSISGFTKAAIYMNGNDFGTLSNKTFVSHIKLTGKIGEGKGIHLYNDGAWKGIDWVSVYKITSYGYDKVIHLQAKHPIGTGVTVGGTYYNGNWINGNTFDDITMSFPIYGVYIESTSVFNFSNNEGVVTSNYFTNLNAQWGLLSKRMVYCDGGLNVFTGVAFDFPIEYEFTAQSKMNRMETVLGNGIDKGTKNQITRVGAFPVNTMIGTAHVAYPTFAGLQDDFLAYADKRFTVTQKSGPAPSVGNLSTLFSHPSEAGFSELLRRDAYVAYNNTASNPVVIQIDFPVAVNYMELIRVQFIWGAPKSIKIEMFSDQFQWMNMKQDDNNVMEIIDAVSIDSVMAVKSIRITFSHTSTISINRIMGFTSHYAGSTYLPRSGGKLFGGLDLGNNLNMSSYPINGINYAEFLPVAKTQAVKGSLFIDTVDKQLKFKDFSDIFHTISNSDSIAIDVKSFGAKGDGITDDTAAFNNAINALTSGGTVLVPPGLYMIEGWATGSVSDYPLGGIKLKSNITMQFQPGAKLKVKPTTKDNYTIINITACNNVKIFGGEFIGERDTHIDDPNGQWGYGIAVVGSNDVVIENATASNCFGDGFYVGHNSGVGTESKRVRLVNCNADNNRRQGLSITGAIDVTIEGGSYRNTNGHLPESGIDLEPNPGRVVRDVKIKGANCEGNAGHGIQVGKDSSIAVLTANVCKNNGNHGIYIGESNDNIVKGNFCYDNTLHGMFILTANNNTIDDNHIFNNGWYGIYMGQSNHNLIHNNHIYSNSQVYNASYDNINLWDSNYNSIQSNVIRAGSGAKKSLNGIHISTATCQKNLVVMNDCYDGGTSLGIRDVGNFTETTAGNRKKDGTWGQYAG